AARLDCQTQFLGQHVHEPPEEGGVPFGTQLTGRSDDLQAPAVVGQPDARPFGEGVQKPGVGAPVDVVQQQRLAGNTARRGGRRGGRAGWPWLLPRKVRLLSPPGRAAVNASARTACVAAGPCDNEGPTPRSTDGAWVAKGMPMTEAEWLACVNPNPMLKFLR